MTEAESLRHRVLTLEDCSRKLARRLAQTTEELCVCKATLDKHGISTITGDARREEQPSMFQTLWSDFSKSIASAFGLTEVTTAAARNPKKPPKEKNLNRDTISRQYQVTTWSHHRIGTCNDALLQLNDLQGLLEIKQLECERLKLDKQELRDNSQLLEDLHPVDARTPDRMSMSPRGGAGGDAAARHDEGGGANDGVAEFLAPTFSMQEYNMQDVISQIELIEQEEQKTLEDIFEGTDWERLMKCDPLTKEELAFRAEQNKRARTSSLALLEDKRLVEMLDLSPVIRSSSSSRSKATAESGWPQELRDGATSLSFDGGTTSTVAEVVEGGGVGSAVKTEGATRSRTQHFQLEDPEEPGDGDTAEGKQKD
eukprot:g16499.t1